MLRMSACVTIAMTQRSDSFWKNLKHVETKKLKKRACHTESKVSCLCCVISCLHAWTDPWFTFIWHMMSCHKMNMANFLFPRTNNSLVKEPPKHIISTQKRKKNILAPQWPFSPEKVKKKKLWQNELAKVQTLIQTNSLMRNLDTILNLLGQEAVL